MCVNQIGRGKSGECGSSKKQRRQQIEIFICAVHAELYMHTYVFLVYAAMCMCVQLCAANDARLCHTIRKCDAAK